MCVCVCVGSDETGVECTVVVYMSLYSVLSCCSLGSAYFCGPVVLRCALRTYLRCKRFINICPHYVTYYISTLRAQGSKQVCIV